MDAPHRAFEPFWCADSHWEGEDLVCDTHDWMWVPSRQFCNAISDEQVLFINAALRWYQFTHSILDEVDTYRNNL